MLWKAVWVPLGKAQMMGSPKTQMSTLLSFEMTLRRSLWQGLLFLESFVVFFCLAFCFGLTAEPDIHRA